LNGESFRLQTMPSIVARGKARLNLKSRDCKNLTKSPSPINVAWGFGVCRTQVLRKMWKFSVDFRLALSVVVSLSEQSWKTCNLLFKPVWFADC
jgi:hypothetical protein